MVTYQPPSAHDVYAAVADPTRRAILDRLSRGEQPVTRIALDFPMSRPAISKHLRVLRDASLVTERRDGRNRVYRLNPTPLKQIDKWLEQYRSFWEANLQSLKQFVESKGENQNAN